MDKEIIVRKVENDPVALTKVFALREEVFIDEQKVAREEEFDEFENESYHFLATDDKGDAIGVARWRRTPEGIKLERFAVKMDWRGKGVGSALVAAVVDDVEKAVGNDQRVYLHAQLTAVPLYEKFDFKKKGDQFLECDIWHYEMERG